MLFLVDDDLRSGVELRSNFKVGVDRRLLMLVGGAVAFFNGAEELSMLSPFVVVALMNLPAFFQGIRFFLKSYLTMSRACLSISRPRSLQMSYSSTLLESPSTGMILAWAWLVFVSFPVPQRLQQYPPNSSRVTSA